MGDFAKAAATGIDKLDFEGRQRLIRIIVEQVRVTGWQVEVHLRVPLDPPAPLLAVDPRTRPSDGSPSSRGRGEKGGAEDPGVFSQDGLRSLGVERSITVRH